MKKASDTVGSTRLSPQQKAAFDLDYDAADRLISGGFVSMTIGIDIRNRITRAVRQAVLREISPAWKRVP